MDSGHDGDASLASGALFAYQRFSLGWRGAFKRSFFAFWSTQATRSNQGPLQPPRPLVLRQKKAHQEAGRASAGRGPVHHVTGIHDFRRVRRDAKRLYKAARSSSRRMPPAPARPIRTARGRSRARAKRAAAQLSAKEGHRPAPSRAAGRPSTVVRPSGRSARRGRRGRVRSTSSGTRGWLAAQPSESLFRAKPSSVRRGRAPRARRATQRPTRSGRDVVRRCSVGPAPSRRARRLSLSGNAPGVERGDRSSHRVSHDEERRVPAAREALDEVRSTSNT